MASGTIDGGDDAAAPAPAERIVVRVVTPGKPSFLLQKGEQGLSVFDPESVAPALTEAVILSAFRPVSLTTVRTVREVEAAGLVLIAVPGDPNLPLRLQQAHAEIRPRPGMPRSQFKSALKGLE